MSDEKPCTHFDGAAFLVRPMERSPHKLECSKCSARWHPARGDAWVHVEELAAPEAAIATIRRESVAALEVLRRENSELRREIEARPPGA